MGKKIQKPCHNYLQCEKLLKIFLLSYFECYQICQNILMGDDHLSNITKLKKKPLYWQPFFGLEFHTVSKFCLLLQFQWFFGKKLWKFRKTILKNLYTVHSHKYTRIKFSFPLILF
jgi:hypothetical protein